MSREKTDDELKTHKEQAISALSSYMDSLISSDDSRLKGKADKLSYWLQDWTRFLDFEPQFNAQSLRRYKRGEIIKVHLGFNVGSEEGGLHYAVVIEKNNPKSSPVITIVPLTSVKPGVDVRNLKRGSLFLGNELFTSLSAKLSATERHFNDEINLMLNSESFLQNPDSASRIQRCQRELFLLGMMRREISSMKRGSIALVNQITTISKIRIYDPKTDHDILSNIKLSNEKLDMIDSEIRNRYTNL